MRRCWRPEPLAIAIDNSACIWDDGGGRSIGTARVDRLAAAAGIGQFHEAKARLETTDNNERRLALALAAQLSQVEAVELLLATGKNPNRYNPMGAHSHSTPLHQAVAGGHQAIVRMLVEYGARLDIADKIHHGKQLGWAEYCNQRQIADYLRGLT